MPLPRRLTVALTCCALLSSAAPALAARILPPGDRYGSAAVDLSTNGRAAVAYERSLPGPDLIRVAIRRADRLNRPTVGRDIGRGSLELVRVGGVASGPHLVAWRRRGELRVSVLNRGAWRIERLPAEVRSYHALTAAIAGSRVVLVAGDGANAVALVRVANNRWVSRPLPVGPPRSALVARASEPSGRVVVAWTESGVTGPSVAASSFDPGTLQWAPPTTLTVGAIPSPVPDDVYLNGRGDAIVSLVTSSSFTGTRPVVALVRFLPALSGTWLALPDVPVPSSEPGVLEAAVMPAGGPVYARLGGGVRVAFLTGGAWSAEELAWSGPSNPDAGFLFEVDDLAVAQGGRVVASVAVDPGPGPDDHVFLVRAPVGGSWSAPKRFASLYGPPRADRRRAAGGRLVGGGCVRQRAARGRPRALSSEIGGSARDRAIRTSRLG